MSSDMRSVLKSECAW